APCSFLGECADVHFVNRLAPKRQARPFCIFPREFRWIDYARRRVRPIRLKARRRIGIKVFVAVHSKPITSAGTSIDGPRKIAALAGCKGTECWLRARNAFQNDVNFGTFWS